MIIVNICIKTNLKSPVESLNLTNAFTKNPHKLGGMKPIKRVGSAGLNAIPVRKPKPHPH